MKDIVIIGAGIIGSFLAYDLSKYKLDVAVLEQNKDVACGATKANSAIVHSGHDPKEGTLKALLNVRGSRMYEDICARFDLHYKKIGAYVLACGNEEENVVRKLQKQAEERGIPHALHNHDEILQNEPNLSDEVTLGLYLPSTAIITPWSVATVLMDNAIERGVQLHLETKVLSIDKKEDYYEIVTTRGMIQSKMVINCAGVHADEIAKMVNDEPGFTIKARRGEYFVLDHMKKPVVNHILFPVPSVKGKGVLLVPTIHDNLLLGPTSDFIEDKEDLATTKSGLDSVKSQVNKLVKDVPMHQVIRTFSGNRPAGSTHDFVIKEDEKNLGFIHVGAIESPGIASAPAISEYVIEQLVSKKITLNEKETLPPLIKRQRLLNEMSEDERQNKIKEDQRYGHIVCRCESISEGEIVEAIGRNTPATTVGAIKRRLRPGMGRCQGGFCEPLIMAILARELHKDMSEITLEETGSNILMERR